MVEWETADLVKKEVIESFAFSYASSYIFFVNMTTSIMCSHSMILSASKKRTIPHLQVSSDHSSQL
jgi:hypothetical protein